MSMNPARTIGSALIPGVWTACWIYFIAPPLGMLAAAMVHTRMNREVACAKLHHQNGKRCIFCEYQRAKVETPGPSVVMITDLSEVRTGRSV